MCFAPIRQRLVVCAGEKGSAFREVASARNVNGARNTALGLDSLAFSDNGSIVTWLILPTLIDSELDSIMNFMVTGCIVVAASAGTS